MDFFYRFLIRLGLSITLAFILSLLFFEGVRLVRVSVLAIIMLVLAYLFEYTRKRERNEG